MTIQVKNLDRSFAAVITGADLSKELDKDTLNAVQKVIDERCVVVFKNQQLTPEQQTRFASNFGTLLVHQHSKNIIRETPGISVLSNIQKEGKNIGVPDAGMVWHTDGSYLSHPDMNTFLYGIEIPIKDGVALGNTLYANAHAAYDALSEDMKAKLAPLTAYHSLEYHSINRAAAGGTKVEITEELRNRIPDRTQPVIRTHPHTGKKALYVSEGHTTKIAGMDEAESRELLKLLCEHLQRPEFVYSHSWEKGDLVMWDNAAVQHRATADYQLPLTRHMRRVATEGAAVF